MTTINKTNPHKWKKYQPLPKGHIHVPKFKELNNGEVIDIGESKPSCELTLQDEQAISCAYIIALKALPKSILDQIKAKI